jgi:hypothetical protein
VKTLSPCRSLRWRGNENSESANRSKRPRQRSECFDHGSSCGRQYTNRVSKRKSIATAPDPRIKRSMVNGDLTAMEAVMKIAHMNHRFKNGGSVRGRVPMCSIVRYGGKAEYTQNTTAANSAARFRSMPDRSVALFNPFTVEYAFVSCSGPTAHPRRNLTIVRLKSSECNAAQPA